MCKRCSSVVLTYALVIVICKLIITIMNDNSLCSRNVKIIFAH